MSFQLENQIADNFPYRLQGTKMITWSSLQMKWGRCLKVWNRGLLWCICPCSPTRRFCISKHSQKPQLLLTPDLKSSRTSRRQQLKQLWTRYTRQKTFKAFKKGFFFPHCPFNSSLLHVAPLIRNLGYHPWINLCSVVERVRDGRYILLTLFVIGVKSNIFTWSSHSSAKWLHLQLCGTACQWKTCTKRKPKDHL